MASKSVTSRSRTRREPGYASRAFAACACGWLTSLLACGEPIIIGNDGLVDSEPMCELTEACPNFEVEIVQVGQTFKRIERSRTPYFDPSSCPAAHVNITSGRNDELGRTVAYRLESDYNDDGIIDYRSRVERTYSGDDATSPLATETSWFDEDGDGVDDIRYHYVYPAPGDPLQTFTAYTDIDDDGVIDSSFVTESMETTDASTATTTYTSTTRQDLDGDFVDDLVSVTVRVEVNGYTQSSTTTVTGTDPSQNVTHTMTATYTVDVDVYEVEVDLLSDGVVDARSRSMDTRYADGSSEFRGENDDDADGVVDRILVSRHETLPSGAWRYSYSYDNDGDGVPEQVQRYDMLTGPDGSPLMEQGWFDDDGDAIFERIYTTHYDQNEVTKREFSHEIDGTTSLAVYHEDFCIASPL